MNKFKLVVYFETTELGGTAQPSVDSLLEGSWLMDTDFRGAITSAKLTRRN